jgi:hypothetical protein
MTGRLLKSSPTCLALTSEEFDPIGRSDMGCSEEQRDRATIPAARSRTGKKLGSKPRCW